MCGVCGESLEHVAPMTETLDQSILEDKMEESAQERHFAQEQRKLAAIKLLVGLSVGLTVLLSGIIMITFGGFGSLGLLATGFLFLPLGLWITASVALGGLGPTGAYRVRSYRYLWSGGGGSDLETRKKREARKLNRWRQVKKITRQKRSAGKMDSTRKLSRLVTPTR